MAKSSISTRRPASIADVARQARVSVATVSNILNGTASVRGDTRQRVQQAIRSLGYRRLRARRQSRPPVRTFAYLSNFDQRSVQDAFDLEFIRGISQTVEELGMRLQVVAASDPDRVPDVLNESQVDALIARTTNERQCTELAGRWPMVLLGSYLVEEPISNIEADNLLGMRQVVRHLHSLGHERFGFLAWDMRNTSYRERYWGLQDTLHALDVPFDPAWTFISKDLGPFAERFASAKGDRPTALVCCNDSCAIELMPHFESRGIRIPEDVSLTGFDDLPSGMTARPTLTTVHTHREQRARLAVMHLLDRLEGRVTESLRIDVPTQLIVRNSTGTAT